MDFTLQCTKRKDGDNFQYVCELHTLSAKAVAEFGECTLASIIFEKEEDTLEFLAKKYGIDPEKTLILDYVQRHEDCDVDKKVRNIAGLFLCNLIRKFGTGTKYIYLFALHPKLIKLYKGFGFRSIDESDPRNMLANIEEIESSCGNVELIMIEDK